MLVNTIERDARNDGWKAGFAHRLAECKLRGLTEGSRQANLKAAKNLRQLGLSVENIAKATGLSQGKVKSINH